MRWPFMYVNIICDTTNYAGGLDGRRSQTCVMGGGGLRLDAMRLRACAPRSMGVRKGGRMRTITCRFTEKRRSPIVEVGVTSNSGSTRWPTAQLRGSVP